MFSIRKFVAYTGGAAGVAATIALASTAQAGIAAAPSTRLVGEEPVSASVDTNVLAPSVTLSPACSSAVQALKSAITADATEDQQERSMAMTDADAADPSEDSKEIARFHTLFATIRTACAPALPTTTVRHTFAPSAQCSAAIQAVKNLWAQGRPTTQAQWTNLFTLMKAARTACGWTWSDPR